MEEAFRKHFDRPRIDAFQKPLREVLDISESRVARRSVHPFERKKVLDSDTALVSECKAVLATNSTDLPKFAALMDRLLPRLETLSRTCFGLPSPDAVS